MKQLVRTLLRVSGASLGVATMVQSGSWWASRRTGRVNVVDVAWGPGIAGIAATSALFGAHGSHRRGFAVAAGVTAWAVRLSVHVGRASAGRGEDPRYAEMLDGAGTLERLAKVFVTQGVAQWMVSLPIQVAAVSGPVRGRSGRAISGAGAALALTGGILEALADHQKQSWKTDPGRGSVMDQGLWAWSRHPNYFGDACLWWGVYLVCAASGHARWTIASPAFMSWTLVEATGARRAERMRTGDPAYAAYQDRVSFFLPRPPRH